MISTDAWILHAGADPAVRTPGALERGTFTFPDPDPDEVLVEPLFGSWEANLGHAIARSPIDVCHQRGEPAVILGNIGVVRVVDTAAGFPADTLCMVMPFGRNDADGYVELAHAYDAPGTIGLLARRTKLPARVLLPLPAGTAHSAVTWAATYGRHFTAWDNWEVTRAAWRAQSPRADPADHLVFAWGGGVALAELELARREGFTVAMTASHDHRLRMLAERGIVPVDRREFRAMTEEDDDTPEGRERVRAARGRFDERIAELSGGRGVSIFLDNIGGRLYRPTLRSLARQGVLSTVGWREGMEIAHKRASECIKRHLHVHTHVWRAGDSATIRDLCESTGWMAEVDPHAVYAFDDVPKLDADYSSGALDSYFPLYAVAGETGPGA